MEKFDVDENQQSGSQTSKGIFLIALAAMIVAVCIAVILPITMSQKLCQQSSGNLAGTPTIATTASPPTIPTATPTSTTKKPTTNAPTTPAMQATTMPITPPPTSCPAVNDNDRIDCFPDYFQSSEQTCRSRGCCWAATNVPNAPYCFYPQNYRTYYVSKTEKKSYGQTLELTRDTATPVQYGSRISTLTADIQYQTNERLRIKIYDPNNARYEVPITMPNLSGNDAEAPNPLYQVQIQENPFAIKVIRKATGKAIFDTTLGPLHFENQYLEWSTKLLSKDFYGIGEHEHRSFKHQQWNWKRWGLFARDQPPTQDGNLYGTHPMYFNIEDDQANSHAVLFFNSNAMEAVLSQSPAITWRSIGGIVDFFIFMGPQPKQAISQYVMTTGAPYFPPYWALGFQLCRYGYGNVSRVRQVLSEMRAYDIPQDVQYGDIDYMQTQLDFTYDPVRYKDMPALVNEVHSYGQKYIIILDPAIDTTRPAGTYPAFDEGKKMGVFVNNSDGTMLLGKVWPPGNASFPDYTAPQTSDWWTQLCVDFHKTIPFDGLWIDMNEPANFGTGSIIGCPNNPYNAPPYKPHGIWGPNLNDKTICMDSIQNWGVHYNVHNLYGHSEMEPSLRAARASTNKRSLVISRSTYVSSGKFGGHWLGDNAANWNSMAYSIIGSLEFNLFGIPYIGADICGFFGDSTAKLCNRWTQLGAFYTYSRNHNTLNAKPHHPPAFGAANANSARKVLHTRYRLLPYLYNLHYEATTAGATIMRALMLEFPTDKTARGIDKQFLWGSGLLITPVLTMDAVTVDGYFPDARWYDYYTGAQVGVRRSYLTLSAPFDHIPLHVRGGSIFVQQEPANTTYFARQNSFSLLIAMDDTLQASGNLFWDDGETINTIANGQYLRVNYKATKSGLTATVVQNSYTAQTSLNYITVYGLSVASINQVQLNGTSTQFDFSNNYKMLNITGLNMDMNKSYTVTWS